MVGWMNPKTGFDVAVRFRTSRSQTRAFQLTSCRSVEIIIYMDVSVVSVWIGPENHVLFRPSVFKTEMSADGMIIFL
jgi:hypothetical protein